MSRAPVRGLCPCFLSGEELSRAGKAASFFLGLCRTVVCSTTRTRHGPHLAWEGQRSVLAWGVVAGRDPAVWADALMDSAPVRREGRKPGAHEVSLLGAWPIRH